MIIVSPYQRTQQTAAPLIARFPQVPLQTWPVQEFTYLNTKAHAGTTEQQRAIHAQAYWERCDPHWRDGAGAESFADFIQRIDTLGQRLREHRRLRVVVFTHGYFIKGFQLRSDYFNDAIDTAFMARFREVRRTGLLANAQVLEL